ncbi:DUF4442 domain-containing protein [Thalassotalea sp. M1531]|uniref:DUF4442 domain-containing protein n=1 Tax=Thalassotalea algicola TaxID=2716224 RepID=A0A7Y0LDS3_9GAMM|nr:DUF4442 domain-containing protein [Thalassotalea algicola]NMP32694.1 DUF4442 domain-containing protein [Thalassotalea algicola]
MNLMFSKAWLFKLLINIWPPLFFYRIKLKKISADFREASVEMKLSAWNRNGVGTIFGGSLFAMTDPFYMMMLMARLRDEYIIWDKCADIDFIKPGKGKVTAEFIITDQLLNDIEENTASGEKFLPQVTTYIKDESGDVVAAVNRTLYIRRKKKYR